jgi:hypothetical protein
VPRTQPTIDGVPHEHKWDWWFCVSLSLLIFSLLAFAYFLFETYITMNK